jgi:hypothetical protein
MQKYIFGLALVAVAAMQFQSLADTSTQSAGTVTVPIGAVGSSAQTGTATLTGTTDGKTQVVIALNGEPAGATEPAHIHPGTCGKGLNPKPVYGLNPVSNGTSTTMVDVPLDKIQTGGFAINVHESAANIANYVACGNIPAASAGNAMPQSSMKP